MYLVHLKQINEKENEINKNKRSASWFAVYFSYKMWPVRENKDRKWTEREILGSNVVPQCIIKYQTPVFKAIKTTRHTTSRQRWRKLCLTSHDLWLLTSLGLWVFTSYNLWPHLYATNRSSPRCRAAAYGSALGLPWHKSPSQRRVTVLLGD